MATTRPRPPRRDPSRQGRPRRPGRPLRPQRTGRYATDEALDLTLPAQDEARTRQLETATGDETAISPLPGRGAGAGTRRTGAGAGTRRTGAGAGTRRTGAGEAGTRRPSLAGWTARGSFVIAIGLVAVWYVLSAKPVRSDNLASALILAIGALSLNVLVGYTGQISLGHQAFIGIGAFTSAYAMSQSHQSFYIGLALGAAVGAAQALLLGLVALRVRGLYFALVTLAWGAVGENSIFRLKTLTRGGAGQQAARPGGFTTDRGYLVICAIALAVILLIDWRLVATKAGRALQALRESPQVASSYGINVRAYTLFAFGVAGAYAGLAGALFASRRLNVVANDFTFAGIALPYLIVTVVGGLRRRGGIVLFAILFVLGQTYLPDIARNLGVHYLEINAGYIIQILAGVLAILTLVFQPDGLGSFTAPIGKWLIGGRFRLNMAAGSGAEGISVRP